MGQRDWHRHQFRCFIRCIAKHHALVTSTDFIKCFCITFFNFQGVVNAHSNISGLFVKGYQDATSIAIKAVFSTGITDIANGIASDARDIHVCIGRNFTYYVNETCRHQCFTSYARMWIFCDDCIQYSIGDLVSNFIRMTFRYGFRCKEHMFICHYFLLYEKKALR